LIIIEIYNILKRATYRGFPLVDFSLPGSQGEAFFLINMNYETTAEIEIAIAKHYDWRQNLIVPNVSWGLLFHEADILVMSKAGYLTEIEIKVSRSDLIADKTKSHQHQSRLIKSIYFAIPEKLEIHAEHILPRAGIYIVGKTGKVKKIREAEINKESRILKDEEKYNLARLGTMRIWNLKENTLMQMNSYKNLLNSKHYIDK